MARLAQRSSEAEHDDELRPLQQSSAARRQGRRQAQATTGALSPSPDVSFSSDKENRTAARAGQHQEQSKDKTAAARSGLPTPPANPTNVVMSSRSNKRRRLGEHDTEQQSTQIDRSQCPKSELRDPQKYYDPDQPLEERRVLRKNLRELSRQLIGSQAEYLAPGNNGLLKTVKEANQLFASVKQTSDATLDSRLLVSAADFSYKKTAQLTLGDAAQGIDVDEFVSKCISFMRRGGPSPNGRGSLSSSQRSRRDQGRRGAGATQADASASEDEAGAGAADDEDALDWEVLGRRACFPSNRRPPVPGFLLGPLSIQKRVRATRTQRGRQPRRDPADVVRPQELKATDLEKVENSNLTNLCKRIRTRLVQVARDAEAAIEAEVDDDTPSDEAKRVISRHGMCDDGGIPFFAFVVNPRSFGQTVENLFYVSFLIRDGSVGIGADSDKLPTLHATQPRKISEMQEQGVQKHQAVFNLDWHTWEELIKVFDISRPLIPHREDDDSINRSAAGKVSGWYG